LPKGEKKKGSQPAAGRVLASYGGYSGAEEQPKEGKHLFIFGKVVGGGPAGRGTSCKGPGITPSARKISASSSSTRENTLGGESQGNSVNFLGPNTLSQPRDLRWEPGRGQEKDFRKVGDEKGAV